jgi:hypothetical protein
LLLHDTNKQAVEIAGKNYTTGRRNIPILFTAIFYKTICAVKTINLGKRWTKWLTKAEVWPSLKTTNNRCCNSN